ncbi:MAG: hypothetical protein V1901_04110 [Patescibacteria group bacterium]
MKINKKLYEEQLIDKLEERVKEVLSKTRCCNEINSRMCSREICNMIIKEFGD